MDLPLTPGLVVLSETDALDETTLHGRWRTWLALFNTFQALPGFLMATERGLEMGDYGGLAPAVVAAPAEGPAATLGGAWASAFESAVEDVSVGLRRLADAGVDIPEIGYEYADDQGVVIAEAELAWPRVEGLRAPRQSSGVQRRLGNSGMACGSTLGPLAGDCSKRTEGRT